MISSESFTGFLPDASIPKSFYDRRLRMAELRQMTEWDPLLFGRIAQHFRVEIRELRELIAEGRIGLTVGPGKLSLQIVEAPTPVDLDAPKE